MYTNLKINIKSNYLKIGFIKIKNGGNNLLPFFLDYY